MKKIVSILLLVAITLCMLAGCDSDYQEQTSDVEKQQSITKDLQQSQPTPTDIDYSLERYNLIRRAYWVNGQREKALSLPCPVEKPLGYVVLMLEAILGNFVVDGKVSSLNSFLTPDTTYPNSTGANWLADVDGSYGENDNGIFFFTTDGKYIEWTGTYIYSDIPYIVDDPILKVQEEN